MRKPPALAIVVFPVITHRVSVEPIKPASLTPPLEPATFPTIRESVKVRKEPAQQKMPPPTLALLPATVDLEMVTLRLNGPTPVPATPPPPPVPAVFPAIKHWTIVVSLESE